MLDCLRYIFCCCPKDVNKTKNRVKQSKYTKDQLVKKPMNSYQKYATNFDSQRESLTKWKDKGMVVNNMNIEQKQFPDRVDFYQHILSLQGYEIIGERIGKGAFGDVYKVKKLSTGQVMAVKIMHLKKSDNFNKTRFEAFEREVMCLKTNPHKHIIQMIQHFIVNDFISFIIMEFADAGDLKQRLKHKHDLNARAFDEFEARTYFVQISEALHFVHSNRLIHGDLKLDNVLIKREKDGKEVLKVTDFGCANVAFDAKTGVVLRERAVGTVIYMAPEQLRVYMYVNLKMTSAFKYEFNKYNPFKSDIWALGVCLYRLLFYDYPFTYVQNDQIKSLPKMLIHMKTGYNEPQNITKDMSDDCKDILKGLLEYNKESRMDIKSVMSHKWVVAYGKIKP